MTSSVQASTDNGSLAKTTTKIGYIVTTVVVTNLETGRLQMVDYNSFFMFYSTE